MHGRDFGTYVHDLLEIHAKTGISDISILVQKYGTKAKRRCPKLPQFDKDVAQVLLNRYFWFYSGTNYRYIHAEDKFNVPYQVRGYRKVNLLGRFDEIIDMGDGTIGIQENKTKKTINYDLLESTIPYNLQTMMYAIAAQLKYKKRVSKIIYNVIRRPAHSQSKKETYQEFIERLDAEMEAKPKHFFYRVEYPLSQQVLDQWKRRTFDPLLVSLIQWWESVKNDPFSPWEDADGLPNPHHWMRPFGVFDSLTLGTGDFYEIIVRGRDASVSVGNPPFEELK